MSNISPGVQNAPAQALIPCWCLLPTCFASKLLALSVCFCVNWTKRVFHFSNREQQAKQGSSDVIHPALRIPSVRWFTLGARTQACTKRLRRNVRVATVTTSTRICTRSCAACGPSILDVAIVEKKMRY